MFNQITIHRGLSNSNFDIGSLAETMVFYKDILLLMDRGSLNSLIDAIGQETVIRLADEFGIKFSYHREMFATLTNTTNNVRTHNFTDIKVGGLGGKKIRSVHAEIEYSLTRKLGSSRRTRKFINDINDRTSARVLKKDEAKLLIESARSDLNDTHYTQKAAETAISILAPSAKINDKSIYRVIDLGTDGFIIDTNMNFESINNEYKKILGQENGSLTDALIATYIFSARADAYFASCYMSGYVCDPVSSALMRQKFLELIRRRERDAAEIDLFQEKTLSEGRTIREALNSGEVKFLDMLSIINKGHKFKDWLSTKNPDESLLKEYFREVSRETWLQTLPGKTFRWITTGGLGVAAGLAFSPVGGVAATMGLGAIDTFLVERLLKGWRPDQFIEGRLADIIK